MLPNAIERCQTRREASKRESRSKLSSLHRKYSPPRYREIFHFAKNIFDETIFSLRAEWFERRFARQKAVGKITEFPHYGLFHTVALKPQVLLSLPLLQCVWSLSHCHSFSLSLSLSLSSTTDWNDVSLSRTHIPQTMELLDEDESLACRKTSPFTNKLGCFLNKIKNYMQNNLSFCLMGKLSGKLVPPFIWRAPCPNYHIPF